MVSARLAAALALTALVASPATAQGTVENQATISLLHICQEYSAGEVLQTLIDRAASGGFRRDPNLGGALGERLIWSGGPGARVDIVLRRAEGVDPKSCRIEVGHGRANAVALAKDISDWAVATRPAFAPADVPVDPFAHLFGPKPASRAVFARAGERLTVERFDPPAEDANPLDIGYAVTITLERIY